MKAPCPSRLRDGLSCNKIKSSCVNGLRKDNYVLLVAAAGDLSAETHSFKKAFIQAAAAAAA
jgi:hypothetical protein